MHEAYLRLGEAAFADRSGFFRTTAVAMQRILVDHPAASVAAIAAVGPGGSPGTGMPARHGPNSTPTRR